MKTESGSTRNLGTGLKLIPRGNQWYVYRIECSWSKESKKRKRKNVYIGKYVNGQIIISQKNTVLGENIDIIPTLIYLGLI